MMTKKNAEEWPVDSVKSSDLTYSKSPDRVGSGVARLEPRDSFDEGTQQRGYL